MLPRSHACQGAVQRHLPAHFDAIWVPDSLLRREWQRFVRGSRTDRRYGSFVPGPLESRRRTGKRRMALCSEAFVPAQSSIPSWWGSFWEVDRPQWQWQWEWQPPRSRKLESTDITKLKSRDIPTPETITKTKTRAALSANQDILAFRARIKECQPDELPLLCRDFNNSFKHSLTRGVVSEFVIMHALKSISKDLCQAFQSTAATHCLAFYKATWEGLEACEALQINRLRSGVTTAFMKLLSQLPITADVQAIAFSVIARLSPKQLQKADLPICSLVDNIIESWLLDCCIKRRPHLYITCEQDPVSDASSWRNVTERRLLSHNTFPTRFAKFDDRDYIRSDEQSGVERAHSKTLVSESHTPPELVQLLKLLPQETLSKVVRHGSHFVSRYCGSDTRLISDIRYPWLSLVSQIPAADWHAFLQTWKTMEASGDRLHDRLMSIFLLRHWISQGFVRDVDEVEYNVVWLILTARRPGFHSLVLFLASRRRENILLLGQKRLFKALYDLGRYDTIWHVMSAMFRRQIKMRVASATSIIENISKIDPLLALRIYRKYMSVRGNERLRAQYSPNFMLSIINEPRIPTFMIWDIIGLPSIKPIDRRRFVKPRLSVRRDRCRLAPSMVSLLTNMAVAFSRCQTRKPRVVLRQVTKCLEHLSAHRATLSPHLTRAITRASISLHIECGRHIPEERAAWVVKMIRIAEGPEVADTVAMVAEVWNRCRQEKKRLEDGNRNVLRVGLID